ncbi:MAG: 2-isopropylmalate synthase [Leptospiraceae bacterium]|nr:2-isopropylmalate synthase [Leptospiraceae bacterium]
MNTNPNNLIKRMPLAGKYQPFPKFHYPERQWPDKKLEKPPLWCSVDLRDGNQALITPMNIDEKLEFFQYLVKVGFKEIEVGYPSASETEFQFVRKLIEENHIPDDVSIQVLTQSREDLIRRTFESLQGVKNGIVHFYNSTSEVQRRVVFQKSKEEIIQLAVEAADLILELKIEAEKNTHTKIRIQYSPESFTSTEPEYALEICERVIEVFQPTEVDPICINLPATVEVYTPNVYADIVEWFGKNLKNRKAVTLSLHTHNDRGTGVAASELGLLAGADRIEGTLLGNGERTGNADIVNLALNFYSQGIDPGLDFSNVQETIRIFEKCNKLKVPERHPYVGELVFTAFSGSHQDAIHKGFQHISQQNQSKQLDGGSLLKWEVPYIPIDPKDIGKDYTAVVRINSQSGKGGVSYMLEKDFGIVMNAEEKKQFGILVKDYSNQYWREINSLELKKMWEKFLAKSNKLPTYKMET